MSEDIKPHYKDLLAYISVLIFSVVIITLFFSKRSVPIPIDDLVKQATSSATIPQGK